MAAHLEEAPPDTLDNAISHGIGQPEAGSTMHRGTE